MKLLQRQLNGQWEAIDHSAINNLGHMYQVFYSKGTLNLTAFVPKNGNDFYRVEAYGNNH